MIIKHRKPVTVTTYALVFTYDDSDGAGFSFPCNARGIVEVLMPAGRLNYEACLAGAVKGRKVTADGIEKREHTYYEPAVARCSCGRKVELHSTWANGCDCGRELNGSGQELA